jgi:hypothetical protein
LVDESPPLVVVLFPEAFLVLVTFKLYVVTRGALVPEMARTDQFLVHPSQIDDAGWPTSGHSVDPGFAGFNAQLTLLGTGAGLLVGTLGVALLKGVRGQRRVAGREPGLSRRDHHQFSPAAPGRQRRARAPARPRPTNVIFQSLRPHGDADVTWGLTAAAMVRFSVGFTTFLLAFGLRRLHASVGWFAAALTLSAVGALIGLGLATRLRQRLAESTMLTGSLLAIALGALLAAVYASLEAQGGVGDVGRFGRRDQSTELRRDHSATRPTGSAGRTFARFAVRQQLLWVLGAVIPVAIATELRRR